MEMLTDKVALITGGSSGIGAETARVFAKQGAKVAIFARGREKLDQVAAELKALGAECLTITGDVTKSEDCNAAIDRVVTVFGRIDVLVNNAGAGDFHTTTEKCSDEFWDRMIALNQASVLYCCRAALPHMRAQGSGSIVNLSAMPSALAPPRWIAWTAGRMPSLTRNSSPLPTGIWIPPSPLPPPRIRPM